MAEASKRRGEREVRGRLVHPYHFNRSGTTHHMHIGADGNLDTMADLCYSILQYLGRLLGQYALMAREETKG